MDINAPTPDVPIDVPTDVFTDSPSNELAPRYNVTPEDVKSLTITITLGRDRHEFHLYHWETLEALLSACEAHWGTGYKWDDARFLCPTPIGMLKASDELALGSSIIPLEDKKITLMVSRASDVHSFRSAGQHARERAARRSAQRRNAVRPYPSRLSQSALDAAAKYGFLQIQELRLPHLANHRRSLEYLERLSQDPGIRAVMVSRKLTVTMLTEMDPAVYTSSSHEGTSRILGLNRNRGEVIELRLRTDAYDGYRDYRTVRKTLCHELAHNVHSNHDRQFWELCHLIEREVDAADYRRVGRMLADAPIYEPDAVDENPPDSKGWTGGEFIVGGSVSGEDGDGHPLDRRHILARAAEARAKREQRVLDDSDDEDWEKSR